MAHGDAREGKWRGNWRMEWVASTLHTTSEHGVSGITTADATPRLPVDDGTDAHRRFKWTRPFRWKTKSDFCACAVIFQTQCTAVAPRHCILPRSVYTCYKCLTITSDHVTPNSFHELACAVATNFCPFIKGHSSDVACHWSYVPGKRNGPPLVRRIHCKNFASGTDFEKIVFDMKMGFDFFVFFWPCIII